MYRYLTKHLYIMKASKVLLIMSILHNMHLNNTFDSKTLQHSFLCTELNLKE